MDAVVTARVPVEVKNQTAQVLRAIGATHTQLINAAYAYVLETGSLPHAHANNVGDASDGSGASHVPITKSLSGEQRETLRAGLDAMTREVPESFWGGLAYKQIIEEGRRADYEALA